MTLEKLLPYALWLAAGVLSLALSHKSQIDAWAEKNPRLAGFMKLLRSLGLDPWMLVQSLSLIVRGKLPVKLQAAKIVAAVDAPPPSLELKVEVAKQSVAPRKPVSVPPLPLITLCLALASFCLAGIEACSSPPKTPADAGTQASDLAKSVHAGAVLAVRVLDDAAAKWMDSRTEPTASDIEIGKALTGALTRARDALNVAANVDKAIPEVAKDLALATELLASVGRSPPKEALPVLEFIDGYARARGGS